MSPEVANVSAAVCVPSPTLTSWSCVDVDDSVDGVLGTESDCTVQVLEAVRFKHSRVEIIYVAGMSYENDNRNEGRA